MNAVAAFAIAWLVSRLATRLFRPPPGLAAITLAGLPFLKVAVDVARGIPADSFLWLRSQGVQQDLGSFQLGVGVSWLVPRLRLVLGAWSHGLSYSQSAADLAAAFLVKRVAWWAPGVVAAGLLAVGLARLLRRAAAWKRAVADRRRFEADAERVGTVRIGRRVVPVLVTRALDGSPFTTGVLAPCVVVPHSTWEALSDEERDAAIAHEVAHVAERHLLLTTAVGVVRDLFWFVPFGSRAERAFHQACELSADARAVRSGVAPALLASTLLRVREVMVATPAPHPAVLAASGSVLPARLSRLLDDAPPPRLGFHHPALRLALTVWVTAAAVLAVAFGNH